MHAHMLTERQKRPLRFHSSSTKPLPVLMEESPSPPPVPPKDDYYSAGGGGGKVGSMESTRLASSSKRRRDAQDDISYHYGTADLEAGSNDDRPTPSKRSRSHAAASDGEISDCTSQHAAQLRRKGGIRNLSNLNLRHAASTSVLPARQVSPPRESRFVEGSLNDKPSQQPPSVFTRVTRTDSGSLQYVEELMADYHEGMPTPWSTVQSTIEYEKEIMPERVAAINARSKNEDGAGIFRFGKSWGTNFHPVALWNRLWSDTKEEVTRQNMLEAERKDRLKAEAEAKYAQMKRAGLFGVPPAGSTEVASTPQDSAIALDSGTDEHHRTESLDSHARYSHEEQSQEGAAVQEPPRTLRGRLSRMQLRKPSMTSLSGTVKRAKSEFNLAALHRDSSASLSPSKIGLDGASSVLRSSASKYDLKKQNRLSKRVSNLEEKLQIARMELDTALAEASPAPKLTSKFERFTPVNSMKRKTRRPKFIPGALPTLPSERLLFPELRGPETYEETVPRAESEVRTHKIIDLSTAFDDIDDEGTIRRPHVQSHRPHAKEIFQDTDQSIAQTIRSIEEKRELQAKNPANQSIQLDQVDQEIVHNVTASNAEPGNAILDAKLKALDVSVKAAKKPAKSKKRGALAVEDKSFNPGRGVDNDDEEWEEAEQLSTKKKRKSAGKAEHSPPMKKSTAGQKQKSPQSKTTKKTATTTRSKKSNADKQTSEVEVTKSQLIENTGMDDAVLSEDELARPKTAEEGDDLILEPLYEEEEEMSVMPLNDEPREPTATATPARHGRSAVRPRSNSMHKRASRATSRQSKSVTPPLMKSGAVQINATEVLPAKDGSRDYQKQRGSKDENFEWPDDVF